MTYVRGTCGKDRGFPFGKHYCLTLRGDDLEHASGDGRRRDGRNRVDGYKDDFIHPIGRDRAHLIGNCAELSVALGTGLEWTGRGQKGKQRIDVGEGVFQIQVKGTEGWSSALKLTNEDRKARVEVPYVLVYVQIYPNQVCCYPVAWQWRSKIPDAGLSRFKSTLRNMDELLGELERRDLGTYREAVG